jgi:hypothetical protein
MDTSVDGSNNERCAVVGLLGSVLISTNFLQALPMSEIQAARIVIYLICIEIA